MDTATFIMRMWLIFSVHKASKLQTNLKFFIKQLSLHKIRSSVEIKPSKNKHSLPRRRQVRADNAKLYHPSSTHFANWIEGTTAGGIIIRLTGARILQVVFAAYSLGD